MHRKKLYHTIRSSAPYRDRFNGDVFDYPHSSKEILTSYSDEIETSNRLFQESPYIPRQLLARIYELAEMNLTDVQKKVFSLWMKNLTLSEIAQKLDCNYTSVYHCLCGSRYYVRKKYTIGGGIWKKLTLLIDKDPVAKQLYMDYLSRRGMDIDFSSTSVEVTL